MEERTTKRGRPFKFPDPAKRSKAEPQITVDTNQIIGLYNQANQDNAKNITDKVRQWFEREAKKRIGWDEVSFSADNSCMLKMNF